MSYFLRNKMNTRGRITTELFNIKKLSITILLHTEMTKAIIILCDGNNKCDI